VLSYKGKTNHYKDKKGLTYISYLLATPHHQYHASQLVASYEGREDYVIEGSHEKVLDTKARSDYNSRLQELKQEYAKAKRDNETYLMEKSQNEIDTIEKEALTAIGYNGQSRKFSNNADKARRSVSNCINRALDDIKKEQSELWKHLFNAINKGEYLIYSPEQHIDWSL
jgi:hypothetical protein